MADYQILTCPNCNGVGCPTCQGTGKVRVAADQLQKLKSMVGQLSPQTTGSSSEVTAGFQPEPTPARWREPSGPGIIQTLTGLNQSTLSTTVSGLIAFSFLSILSGAAYASLYFLKTLKPFLFGLVTLLTLIGPRLAWTRPFFKLQEPNDFLSAIKTQ